MGKARRNAVDIEADMADGYKALGFVQGMSEELSTDRFIGPVIEFAHSRMAESFDDEIDSAAGAGTDSLQHVYEWRMLGLPQGRLWRHTLTGRGENRQASWKWVASKAPILTPSERKAEGDPSDPINNVSDEALARLSDRKYIFYWKAPIVEYGLSVNIRPVYAKALFVPTDSNARGYYFSKGTSNQFQEGGQGKFTAFWTTWWANGASALWSAEIKRTIEKDLGRSRTELAKVTGRRRKKSFGINAMSDNFAAYEAGRNMAEAYIKGKAKSYKQAAKYVDRYGQFGDEVNY